MVNFVLVDELIRGGSLVSGLDRAPLDIAQCICIRGARVYAVVYELVRHVVPENFYRVVC